MPQFELDFRSTDCVRYCKFIKTVSCKSGVTGRGNILYGDKGNDVILGGAGNDQLFGQRDLDVLDGGIGDDELTGGINADYFSFTTEGIVGFGNDIVWEFQDGGHRLDVRNVYSTSDAAHIADSFSDFVITT